MHPRKIKKLPKGTAARRRIVKPKSVRPKSRAKPVKPAARARAPGARRLSGKGRSRIRPKPKPKAKPKPQKPKATKPQKPKATPKPQAVQQPQAPQAQAPQANSPQRSDLQVGIPSTPESRTRGLQTFVYQLDNTDESTVSPTESPISFRQHSIEPEELQSPQHIEHEIEIVPDPAIWPTTKKRKSRKRFSFKKLVRKFKRKSKSVQK